MRQLDSFETTVISGSEGVEGELLFFSPDSRSIGFRIGSDLVRAQLAGGRPIPVTQIRPATREGDWGADGTFVIAQRNLDGLLRLSADGGELDSIAVSDALQAEGFNQFWYPQLIDDDNAVLVTAAGGMQPDSGGLVVIDLATHDARTVLPLASAGHVLPTGFLLFVRGNDLWAARFDRNSREVVGEPTVALRRIRVEGGGAVQLTVADNGTIAFIEGMLSPQRMYQLVWVDREGREEIVGPPGTYELLAVSPDETRVAVSTFADGNWDIRVLDLVRGGVSLLTTDTGLDSGPIWSPDGMQVYFSSVRVGGSGIFRRSANGTTPEEPVLIGQADPRIWPVAVIPDQNAILIQDEPELFRRASLLMLGEEASRAPLFEESNHVQNPALSPDGRWIAYESLETGQSEIWVRPFPDVNSGRWQLSTNGGERPKWTRGGQSLVFQESGVLIQVDVETEPDVRATNRVVVIDGGYTIGAGMWDVSDDGERFLVRKEITPGRTEALERPRDEIHVIVNFTEELERLLPGE
jgi:serine/threonine-protein kinase